MQSKIISKLFILSGLINIGAVLLFTKCFTSNAIPNVDPEVMSHFGLVMIMVWGLAFIAVAKNYAATKWIVGVFAIEKLIYGIVWTRWILENDISGVYDTDMLAGIFYTIYGINDWSFFLFFSYVFMKLIKR